MSHMSPTAQKVAIKFAKPHHDEIARMLVIGNQSQKQIAKKLGLSQSWLSLLIQQPLLQIKIKKLQEERDRSTLTVMQELDRAAIPAMQQLERTMYTTESERLRVHCATDILDRAGFGKVTKSINTNTNVNVTANMTRDEMISLLAKRLGAVKDESDQHIRDITEAKMLELETQEVEELDETPVNISPPPTPTPLVPAVEPEINYGCLD